MRDYLRNIKSFIATTFNLPFLYSKTSYSQFGEDLAIASYFPKSYKGFFVDIGAHHPFRYSNTYYFYKRGWTGINVDPNPGTKLLFDKVRSRNTNIEKLIGNGKTSVKYSVFNDSAFNTSIKYRSQNVINRHTSGVKYFMKYKQTKLSTLLDKYMSGSQKIDFLSLDVEGAELSVLESNNWAKYKPSIILVEVPSKMVKDLTKTKVHKFLQSKKYEFIGRIKNSSLFKLRSIPA